MLTTNSTFKGDLEYLLEKVKNSDKVSFSKYADGEYSILINENIKNCDGWVFDKVSNNKEYNLLLESFKYSHPDYYVGISCPCCQPKGNVQWMRDNVGSTNITWANIFVNSNYDFFVDNFFPQFNKWNGRVVLFANEKGKDNKLPFTVDSYFSLHLNSWKEPDLSNIIESAK